MVRKFLVSGIMLFFMISYTNLISQEKKHIVTHKSTQEEFFTPNHELQLLNTRERSKGLSSKKNKKSSKEQHDAHAFLVDIPQCVDAYDKNFIQFCLEGRYEFCSKQSVEQLQQFYITELTRLGWNVEIFSSVKEFTLWAIQPLKKLLIIIDKVKGGWFSKDACKVVIIIKEQ